MVNEKVKQLMSAYLSDVMSNACVDNTSVYADGNIPQECGNDKDIPEVEVITPQNNQEVPCCGDKCEQSTEEQPKIIESSMKEAVGLLLASGDTSLEEKRETLLIMAICSEITAMYSYWYSYMSSVTNGKADFDPEFKQHMEEEWEHAEQFAERLRELGCYNPIPLFSEFTECGPFNFIQEGGNNSIDMLKNRLTEEQQAVEFYNVCVNFFRETEDSTTLQLFKKVKATEEEHIKDLRDLLMQYEN